MPGGQLNVPLTAQGRADWRAQCLTAGRYDLLAEEYAYPLTIWLPGRPAVLVTSPAGAWGFFQAFHSALLADGMTRLVARVTAEDLPVRDRRRLWTDWWGEGAERPPELVAQTVCYSRAAAADTRTEMLEFTRLALPMLLAA